MKLYQLIDGTLIGFYQERGGEVQAVIYRDVYESRMVKKLREERVWVETTEEYEMVLLPGHWEDVPWEVPGYWERRAVRIPEHREMRRVEIPGYYERRTYQEPSGYEIQPVWFEEYSITRYREVPARYETKEEYVQGHYEIQNIWVPEYTVTRYYWREASEARGLVGAWIPYDEIIPAGFKDQRVWIEGVYEDVKVWVDAHTEEYEEIFPAGYKDTRVWVEGEWRTKIFWVDATWEYQWVTVPEDWGTKRIWIEPISEIRRTWIESKYVEIRVGEPAHWETKIVEYYETVKVWIGYEPVYGFVDETQTRLFEVGELVRNVFDVPEYSDAITIINRLTGDVSTTSAKYVGMAERIAENEYVVAP